MIIHIKVLRSSGHPRFERVCPGSQPGEPARAGGQGGSQSSGLEKEESGSPIAASTSATWLTDHEGSLAVIMTTKLEADFLAIALRLVKI